MMRDENYASNGKGNAALTTGIIGTTLSGLLTLGANNGNGLLGGLFGNGTPNAMSAYLTSMLIEWLFVFI